MNEKMLRLMLIACLLLSTVSAYQLKDFKADSQIPYGFEGGFTMQVITSSGNLTLEPLDDLDVHVDVLYNDVPIFTYCKYTDDNECYLWKTDQNGKVNGLFLIHSAYLIGEQYTLEVTIGNVTQQQNFTVTESITNPSYWQPIYWIQANLGIFMLVVVFALLGIMSIYHFIIK